MPKILVLAIFLALICIAPPVNVQAQNPVAGKIEQDVDISLLAEAIIQDAAQSAGLLASFGNPGWMIEAGKGKADVLVEFPRGPMPDLAAAEFGLITCARLVQTSVELKAPVRSLGVTVTSPLPDGRVRVYGTALYNGKLAAMIWENSGLNLDANAAPKVTRKNGAQNPAPRAIAPAPGAQTAKPGPAPQQPEEEFVEEEIVVEEAAPQSGRNVGQPLRDRQGVRHFPKNIIPGAIAPKAITPPPAMQQGQATPPPPPCWYGQKNGQAAGTPPPPPGPKPPCMAARGTAPENLAPQPDNAPKKRHPVGPRGRLQPREPQAAAPAQPALPNQPALAGNSGLVQALLNDAAALSSLQGPFGNPSFTILGDSSQTNLLVQFNKGPVPPDAAMNYGLMACEILARSSISRDLSMNNLTVTVCSQLPDGGMNIYGTAIFNGKLDQIAWQSANLIIPAPPKQGQIPQKRPLNLQPGMENPGTHETPDNAQSFVQPEQQKPATRAERRQARREAREQARQERAQQRAAEETAKDQDKSAEKPFQMESAKEKALDNVNEASQASYSQPVQATVNAAVRSFGLQSTYGIPEHYVIAADKGAQILLLFKRGPMPDASAAALGLMTCEQLARTYIVKGLGTRNLSVTIAYTMEDGRRYDYGTAVFNGNLDDLAWVVADHII